MAKVKVRAITRIKMHPDRKKMIKPGTVFEMDSNEATKLAMIGSVVFVVKKKQESIDEELEKTKLQASPEIPAKNHVDSKDLPG